MKHQYKFPASISLIIGVIAISIFPILVKWTSADSSAIAFYRMLIAFICLVPIAIFTKQYHLPSRKTLPYVLGSGALIALDIIIWNQAIKLSTPTQATVIGNTAPIWIGVIAYFFLADKPKKQFWVGALLALSGLVVYMGTDMFIHLKFDWGFILAVLSSIFYAAYILVSKKALANLKIIQFMTYNMLAASLVSLISCWVMGIPLTGYDNQTWGVFLSNGLISQLVGWIAINDAIKKLPAHRVSLSLLSQAIVTGIMAYFLLNEVITLRMFIGGILILGGIAYTFKPHRGKI